MTIMPGVRPTESGGRRFASSLVCLTAILAAAFPGCSSTHSLRWRSSAKDPRGPQPAQPWRDQADAARPCPPPADPGPSKPEAFATEGPEEGDGAVVRVAADAGELTGNPPPAIPPPAGEYPIDLTTALRLAEAENPLIAAARQRIGEALALQQGARALLLPDLNAGVNFHAHTGNLQRSSGRILKLDEQSLYFGGGSEAYAASPVEVPAVNLVGRLTEAIFEPLAARQQVEGARFGAAATANQILREVAELHFELLAAEGYLRSRRDSAAQEAEIARLTRSYALAQQGREADAERAATELGLIEVEIRQAEEEVAVASARLAHRLHLDQSIRLRPIAPGVEMVTIVDPGAPLPDLIRAAVGLRPEVAERVAALTAAEIRHREELCRPFLPTVWLGFSGGAFGGGSNLVKPELGNFGGRIDFDVRAFWTLRNLGFGNLSLQKRRWAEVGQAVGERSRAIAEVRSEVGAAYAEVNAARNQVDVTTRQLASAEAGLREDLERIRNTVGRPIEAVNSLQLLNQARVARIRAVTDYNKAEFRLFVALGSPPPLGEPATAPIPPAPIAAPPLPPLAERAARPDPPVVAARPAP